MNTVWILGDQLSPEHAGLAWSEPRKTRILMIESKARGSVLRYHQIKFVLVYSAMRHFARDLEGRGHPVDYYPLENGLAFEQAVHEHARKHRPNKILVVEPNSYFETEALEKLRRKPGINIEFVPTTQCPRFSPEFLGQTKNRWPLNDTATNRTNNQSPASSLGTFL